MLLIVAVLGSIYAGIATATEAAALGVLGSLDHLGRAGLDELADLQGIADGRHAPVLHDRADPRRRRLPDARAWATSACRATSPSGSRTLGLSKFALILALTAFYVVLGCFLDGISMVVLTMGVIMPTVQKAGIDPLWFGIFIVIVVEMAQVTPPVGFNLFVLQGMTKREIGTIARAAFPFFLLMVLMVVLLYAFPQLVTFLPEQMRR